VDCDEGRIAPKTPRFWRRLTASQYIEVLVAYGDYYFRQNTLESIPYAINLYVQASKIFGPPPETMRSPGTTTVATYATLQGKLDAFSNAGVEMEVQFPFTIRSATMSRPSAVANSAANAMATGIFEQAATSYFCLPPNPKVAQLRDLIDDRLFKIRNSLDINGNAQAYALFDPPLDPGALVRAAASGAGIMSVVNDVSSPMPNYRFMYLIGKALELCAELKQMSSAFLAAKEKGDAERMTVMRTQQEASINALVMDLKKMQLEEASKSLEALQESRRGPVTRMEHYLALIGEDKSKIPVFGKDYQDIDPQIEAPTSDNLRMSRNELLEMEKAETAARYTEEASSIRLAASFLAMIPDTEENIMPMGAGVTLKIGIKNVIEAMGLVSDVKNYSAERASASGARAGRTAQLQRQVQERRLQANIAGREIRLIDKQIEAQQVRIRSASRDIDLQTAQSDNTAKTLEFLTSKYTGEELYTYIENSVRSSFYSIYTLAFDIAKRAERACKFKLFLDKRSQELTRRFF